MRSHLLLYMLAIVSNVLAQPTLNIGTNTRIVGTGAAQLVYGGGALINNGSLSLAAGQLSATGPTAYGGSGAASVANVSFGHSTGSSTLNSLLSVTNRATLSAGTTLNANGQLYLRTDQFPNAELVNNGILTGTVQGLVTRATVLTGNTPYTSVLSHNVSGTSARYQWQSSADNSVWTDVPGATAPTYTATVSAPTYYRCRLTTSNSNYDQTTPALLLNYTATSVCGSPTNTLGQPLVVSGVTDVSCATGSFRILTTGGNGQPINFAGIVGISNTDPYNCVRMVDGSDLVRAINNPSSDIGTFDLRVMQVGGGASSTFAFDFKGYCTSSTPPPSTTTSPPSSTTTTPSTPTPTGCGSPTNTIGQALQVVGVTEINCQTGSFRILTTGGNGQPINYAGIVGLNSMDPYNCVRTVDGSDLVRAINTPSSDIGPFTVRGQQVGGSASSPFVFDFKGYCTSNTPPPSTTTSPPSSTTTTPSTPTPTGCGSPTNTIGQTLAIVGVTDVNCSTGSFRILTTGGNGQPINYAGIVGLNSMEPYNCVRMVDGPDLVRAINNLGSDLQPFMLRGVQVAGSSSAGFRFNFKQYCTGVARPALVELAAELAVTVLGNPTLGESVEVSVSHTLGEPVILQVSTILGGPVSAYRVESASDSVVQRVQLGSSAGVYLLQVSTPGRSKTVKIVRQ